MVVVASKFSFPLEIVSLTLQQKNICSFIISPLLVFARCHFFKIWVKGIKNTKLQCGLVGRISALQDSGNSSSSYCL